MDSKMLLFYRSQIGQRSIHDITDNSTSTHVMYVCMYVCMMYVYIHVHTWGNIHRNNSTCTIHVLKSTLPGLG